MTDIDAPAVRPLKPLTPEAVSMRFWQINRSNAETLEVIDQLHVVTSHVCPDFTPSARPPAQGEGDDGPQLSTTVVEMATRLPGDKQSVQLAFRRCFACLEDVSRACAVGLRSMVPPLTVGDIHPVVLFISRSPGSMGRWRLGFSMYMIPTSFDAEFLTKESLEPGDQDAIRTLLYRLREGDPVALYGEQALLARSAHSAGEFATAVVQAAIAAEILLDALLGLMLWEEGTPPPMASELLSQSLSERLRSAYHGRLGGSWDQSAPGPVGDWRRNLANLRNQVVHSGHRPSENESSAAVGACLALEAFIGERVVATRYRYWRTALIFVGVPGLERRGLWGRRMRALLSESGEDSNSWHRMYGEWRANVDMAV